MNTLNQQPIINDDGLPFSGAFMSNEHLYAYTFRPPPTGAIYFGGGGKEACFKISKEGAWVNPDIPLDEVAKEVIKALDSCIKAVVQDAIEEDRKAGKR